MDPQILQLLAQLQAGQGQGQGMGMPPGGGQIPLLMQGLGAAGSMELPMGAGVSQEATQPQDILQALLMMQMQASQADPMHELNSPQAMGGGGMYDAPGMPGGGMAGIDAMGLPPDHPAMDPMMGMGMGGMGGGGPNVDQAMPEALQLDQQNPLVASMGMPPGGMPPGMGPMGPLGGPMGPMGPSGPSASGMPPGPGAAPKRKPPQPPGRNGKPPQ